MSGFESDTMFSSGCVCVLAFNDDDMNMSHEHVNKIRYVERWELKLQLDVPQESLIS